MYNNCQQSTVRVDWKLEKVTSTRDVLNGFPEGKIIQGATVDNFLLLKALERETDSQSYIMSHSAGGHQKSILSNKQCWFAILCRGLR